MGIINKILSSRKTKKLQKSAKPIKNTSNPPTSSCITPSAHQNFQTWKINVIPAPITINKSPSSSSSNISKNTSISIGIYEVPSIKSFGFEYKFAPYYYFGYGFYGNPYDKNSKQCHRKPIKTVHKMVNIYDKMAISLNKEKNEVIIWRNGIMDDQQNQIQIDNKKEYQF